MASPVEMNVAEDSSSGPVMLMMNKRLRALKKKFNRIVQIEEAKQQGRSINKEQEDVLRSKPQVSALIEEYERLRQPLMLAMKEELAEKLKEELAEKLKELKEELVQENSNGVSSPEPEETTAPAPAPALAPAPDEEPQEQQREEEEEEEEPERVEAPAMEIQEELPEIIHLLYFSQLFDVKPAGTWTKFHERTSCLSYDLVTDDDDSVAHLHESDLDALAAFGSLVTSRPPNTTLSHKEALQNCIAHARNWLMNSEQPIESGFNITYAELRERLNRILGTEYYTMTPELQTVSRQIADAAAGHYGSSYITLESPLEEPYVNGVDSVSNSPGNISDSSGNNADVSQDSTQVTSNDNLEAVAPAEEALPEEKPPVFHKQPGNNGEAGQLPHHQNYHHQQQQQQQRFRGRGSGGYSRGRGYTGRGRGRVGQNGRQGHYYEQSGYYQQKGYYSGVSSGGSNSNSNNNNNNNHTGNRRGRGGGYFSSSMSGQAHHHANGPVVHQPPAQAPAQPQPQAQAQG